MSKVEKVEEASATLVTILVSVGILLGIKYIYDSDFEDLRCAGLETSSENIQLEIWGQNLVVEIKKKPTILTDCKIFEGDEFKTFVCNPIKSSANKLLFKYDNKDSSFEATVTDNESNELSISGYCEAPSVFSKYFTSLSDRMKNDKR